MARPLITFHLVGIPRESPATRTVRQRAAALRAFHGALVSKVMPVIKGYAPGSIGESIRIENVAIAGDEFVADITMPERYASVEEGIQEEKHIEPRPERKAEYGEKAILIFADGAVRHWSTLVPREGQHFISRALDETLMGLCADIMDAVFYD